MRFSDCNPFLCCNKSLEDICVTLGFINIFIRMLYYFIFKFKILMLLTQSCKYCMNSERILRTLYHKIFVVGEIGFLYICAIIMPDLVAIKSQINLILGANQVRSCPCLSCSHVKVFKVLNLCLLQKNLSLLKTYFILVSVSCSTNIIVQTLMFMLIDKYDFYMIESIVFCKCFHTDYY